MKIAFKLMSGLLAAGILAACSVEHTAPVDPEASAGYYYVGYVYDGVTAQTLTDYELSLTYDAPVDAEEASGAAGASGGPVTLTASIDDEGRYRVGPLKPGSDFTVKIASANYREFVSHNEYFNWTPNSQSEQLTELWEAYLFPNADALPTPEITVDIYSENVGQPRPTGKVRLTPNNGYAYSDLNLEGTLWASVDDQVWFNDLDAHNATKILDLTDGVLTIPSGELVYGVYYQATVYSVDGHSYDDFFFTAGATGSQTVILDELDKPGLFLVNASYEATDVADNGKMVLTFNRDIEFARGFTKEHFEEIVDDAFSINSPDDDGDLNYNTLAINANDEEDAQENGTSITIKGNVVTFAWKNVAANFDTVDEDDPILSVTWGNLGDVEIQAVGDEENVYPINYWTATNVTIKLEPTSP